jgi:hypothetical protein
MQIQTLDEYARLVSLLAPEEREEAVKHSHRCGCMSCQKLNFFLVLKDYLEKWERYKLGAKAEVRKIYDDFWEYVARSKIDEERPCPT